MEDKDYGTVIVHLDKLIKDKGTNKTKVSYAAEMTRTQIAKLCKNEAVRFDVVTLSKLCYALDCSISDLLEYVPPTKKTGTTEIEEQRKATRKMS